MALFGYGTLDQANIKLWINMVYEDVATRRRWSWLQSSQTITLLGGQNTYQLNQPTQWTTVTAGAASATQTLASTAGLEVGSVVYFYDPTEFTLRGGSPRVVTSIASTTVVVFGATVFTTTADIMSFDAPPVLGDVPLYWGRLRPSQLITQPEPRFIDPSKMTLDYHRTFANPTNTGTPFAYTIWGGVLEVFPIPNISYTYELYYWTGITEMVNATDVCMIPPQFMNVLVWGALVLAADRDRDEAASVRRQARFDDMLMQMYNAEPFDNQETVLKAEMPNHYYGIFDGPGTIGTFPVL